MLCLFPTMTVIWFQPKQAPQTNTLGVAIPIRFHRLPSPGLADSKAEQKSRPTTPSSVQVVLWAPGLFIAIWLTEVLPALFSKCSRGHPRAKAQML